MVVGTFAGRSDVVETAGAFGAGFAVSSFTAGASFAGWEEAAGDAAGVEEGSAGAFEAFAGGGSASARGAFCSGAGSGAFAGVVVDASEEVESSLDGREEPAFTALSAKYSAQLGSTLEGSSCHCSRSASTSH